jgi:phospholipase C
MTPVLYRLSLLTATCLALSTPCLAASQPASLKSIDTIVVIYMENHSFDNLFGLYPGATGIADAIATAPKQVDKDGKPYLVLPQPTNTDKKPIVADPRFPADLPNAPFAIDTYVPANKKTGDLIHRFYTNQEQINGGRNDKFAALSDAAGLSMGYYDGSTTSLWQWAKRYTLADHFFMGGFGGSFFNHQMIICACAPTFPNAPEEYISKFDSAGHVTKDGPVTPDGYAVNTLQSTYQPHSPKITDPKMLLPPQDAPTIGDRLSDKGISWAWYAGGFDDAVAGKSSELFQFHHQPFAYYRKFGDGTAERAAHLKDGKEFIAAIDTGTLPHVTFYKPIGDLNEHPGYADVTSGDLHLQYILDKLEKSAQWDHMAVIVTWDENGGFYDHVSPPKGDRWGPGTRIPTLVISPFAKKATVDHSTYDTLSILALIEKRWGLKPLAERDAKADPLSGAFQFK